MTLYKYNSKQQIIEINLKRGSYLFELWGAQGGQGCSDSKFLTEYFGGRGAFVSGKVHFFQNQKLFLFIGEKGHDPEMCNTKYNGKGGFNGGGDSGYDPNDDDPSGGGGGATDIRLNNISDQSSLYSRIIVAAGGSGSCFQSYGAPGGDLTGYKVNSYFTKDFSKSDTNQTRGYSLGRGANGENSIAVPSSGGGGGYYGGNRGIIQSDADKHYVSVSSSGSSFISGYKGCNAVDEYGQPTNSPNHYSGIAFSDMKMLNGSQFFLSPDNVLEEGHSGDGAIRITSLDTFSCVINIYNNFLLYSLVLFLFDIK